MAREDHVGAGALLMAFALGAITGAAVALLVAPVAGDETRRYLAERAREGRERATDAAKHGREFVAKQRETFSSAIEKGREAYKQARDAGGGEEA